MPYFTALLCTTCTPTPRNPTLKTAITAHGNTDWHIDTAEEFLTGMDTNGTLLVVNHMPNTWTGRHMHVGMANTSDYYYDSIQVATGADSDLLNGIDRAMLFFDAGHGNPDIWITEIGWNSALDNPAIENCPGIKPWCVTRA